jgi:hypothetical protein
MRFLNLLLVAGSLVAGIALPGAGDTSPALAEPATSNVNIARAVSAEPKSYAPSIM